ncbi:ATP-binding cassette domain-containing protein [Tenacibaculum sp. M341]|uniref:ATP-binding cassette domain-containing protein n=1 Tax=Tenacibaculum sp. M341 TaxID=2530339 RepID=UPI001053EBCD|nr:ATP-binding cassette domain-containing protein [Tenacibaculum sp. M341]TCI84688.1 ATP-binding cassette domain-containing protein [Tenacibaculum sp. M341]
MDILEVSNLTKTYGRKIILNNLNFSCKTGEIIGVFGRNGSGKSTFLKVLFGTQKATSINIKINKKLIVQKNIIPSQKIGYLPQDSFLPKDIKVRDVIPLFFENSNDQDKIFYSPRVASFDAKKVAHLSLGELRYLELLLIGHLSHPFLLLDEPFSMIEPLYKDIISSYLLNLKNKKGIIITDHYYDDVLKITDQNFLLKNGQKIIINQKEDLIKNGYLPTSVI